MEINLNCDLGEKSIHHTGEHDNDLMKIINTANIACGYHAGDQKTMIRTVKIAKKNNVSIGAHPGFNDKKNFGRKKINMDKNQVKKLIQDQVSILGKNAKKQGYTLTHVKPHGALNNMACENYELSFIIGEAIKECNPELIYLTLPLTEMENAAKKLNMKYANEIFADRNYNDNGLLISRSEKNALITDPSIAFEKIYRMLNDKCIYSYSGKSLPCQINSICVHSDSKHAVNIARNLKKKLEIEGFVFKNLNLLSKF